MTLNLLAPALDELFHLTPGFGDMPFQQLACRLGVTLAAPFHDRPMFVFGLAVGVARKEYVQTALTLLPLEAAGVSTIFGMLTAPGLIAVTQRLGLRVSVGNGKGKLFKLP